MLQLNRVYNTNILMVLALTLASCAGGVEDPDLQNFENLSGNVTVAKWEPADGTQDVALDQPITITFSHLIDRASSLDGNVEVFDLTGNRLSTDGETSLSVEEVPDPRNPDQKVNRLILQPPSASPSAPGYWMPEREYIISLANAKDAGLRGIRGVSTDGNPAPILIGDSIKIKTKNTTILRRQTLLRIQSTSLGQLIGPSTAGGSILDFISGSITTNATTGMQVMFSEPVFHMVHDAENPTSTAELPSQAICLGTPSGNCHTGVSIGSIDARNLSTAFFEAARAAASSTDPQAWNSFIHNNLLNPIPATIRTLYGRRVLEITPQSGSSYPNNTPGSAGSLRAVVVALRGWAAQNGYAASNPRALYSGFRMNGENVSGFALIGFIHMAGWAPDLGFEAFPDLKKLLSGGNTL